MAPPPKPEEVIERSLSTLKGTADVDKKIEAVQALEVLFVIGHDFHDFEPLTVALKSALRAPNAQLSHTALSVLPSYITLFAPNAPPAPPLVPASALPRPSSRLAHGRSPSVGSTASAAPSPHHHHPDDRTLRVALLAFLAPPNGVIEKLADGKERVREAARAALLAACLTALKGGTVTKLHAAGPKGKEVETAWGIAERSLREQGLAGKTWRIKEQTLIHLTSLHAKHTYPLRSFLAPLVSLLEDPDATVRETARATIIALFRPSSPQAKAELKKELGKRTGLRKGVVDEVLEGVLRAPQEVRAELVPLPQPEPGEDKKLAGVPILGEGSRLGTKGSVASFESSVASGESDAVDPAYVASARDVENEFAEMAPHFEGKETEHNWLARETSVKRIRSLLKGDAYKQYPEAFMAGLRSILDGVIRVLASLRTTLATADISLMADLGQYLGHALDPLAEAILGALVRMGALTKKIVAHAAQAAATRIICHISYNSKTVALLWTAVQDKTPAMRQYGIMHVRTLVETHASRSRHAIETHGGLEMIEKAVRKALGDANPGVKEQARLAFWSFEKAWPKEGKQILEALDATARKQLEKVRPAEHGANASPSTVAPAPVAKKSSIAALRAAKLREAKAAMAARAPPPPLPEADIPLPPTPDRRLHSSASSTAHASPTPSHARPPLSPPASKALSSSNVRSPKSNALASSLARSAAASPPPTPSSARRAPSRASSRSASPQKPSAPGTPPRGTTGAPSARSTSTPRAPISRSPFASPPTRSSPLRPERRSPATARSQPAARPSSLLFENPSAEWAGDDTFLLARAVPLPGNDDLADDDDLMCFSSPAKPKSRLDAEIEDALKAEAAQAEAAAERLLELGEPEEHGSPTGAAAVGVPPLPAAVVPLPPPRAASPSPTRPRATPDVSTPAPQVKRAIAAAQLYEDSPAVKTGTPRLLRDLEKAGQGSWWLQRTERLEASLSPLSSSPAEQKAQLEAIASALQSGEVDVTALHTLARISQANPTSDDEVAAVPPNGSPLALRNVKALPTEEHCENVWESPRLFARVLEGVLKVLKASETPFALQDAGLLALKNLIEHQADRLSGAEVELFSVLLHLRTSTKRELADVAEALLELLTEHIEPVFGLGALQSTYQVFLPAIAGDSTARPLASALVLKGVGRIMLRLPPEVLEDELPRLQSLLTGSLEDASGEVRQSAVTAIVAAQLVLRDENRLFKMLDVAENKRGLLTYYFFKSSAR